MKLCRFELRNAPGVVRSGMVYGGKVYETDGSEAVAIHEVSDTRLLSPVGFSPSIRLFEPDSRPGDWSGMAEGRAASLDLPFTYLNSSVLVGPQTELLACHASDEINVKPCLAAVIAGAASLLTPEESDGIILGLSLAMVFYAADLDRMERVRGLPPARSHDVGISFGPVITTPEELDQTVIEDPNGRRYNMTFSLQINEDEVARYDTSEISFVLAEAVSFASSTCPVRSGDLLLVNLGAPELARPLQSGDEVRLVSDRLGMLATRVG